MYSDFDRETGEARVEQERDAKVSAARHALRQQGTVECVDCEREIPEARRRAHPSATRCLECQEVAETDQK